MHHMHGFCPEVQTSIRSCLVSIFVYTFYFNKTFMIALETKF